MKLYSKEAVARHLDLTPKRIKQLTDEGVFIESMPGLYELDKSRVDYIRYLRGKNPKADDNINYTAERAKLVRAKRQNEEMDLALKRGEMHRSEDIEKVMTAMLINFKSRLLAIPSEEAPKLAEMKDKTKIFKHLTEKMKEALQELADFKTLFGEEIKEDEEGND